MYIVSSDVFVLTYILSRFQFIQDYNYVIVYNLWTVVRIYVVDVTDHYLTYVLLEVKPEISSKEVLRYSAYWEMAAWLLRGQHSTTLVIWWVWVTEGLQL